MQRCPALDQVLSALARSFGSCADLLLDLREWVQDGDRAGSCVKAYFELMEEAPSDGRAAAPLASLREWLQQRLEIAVFDGDTGTERDRLPVSLMGTESLEDCCHGAMNSLRADRYRNAKRLRMEFRFRPELAVAA